MTHPRHRRRSSLWAPRPRRTRPLTPALRAPRPHPRPRDRPRRRPHPRRRPRRARRAGPARARRRHRRRPHPRRHSRRDRPRRIHHPRARPSRPSPPRRWSCPRRLCPSWGHRPGRGSPPTPAAPATRQTCRCRFRWSAAPPPGAPSACPTTRRLGEPTAPCRPPASARRRTAAAPTPTTASTPCAIRSMGAWRPRPAPPAPDRARVCAGSQAPGRPRCPRPRAENDRARTSPRERSRRKWALARPRGPLKWTRPSKGSGLRDGAAARSSFGGTHTAGTSASDIAGCSQRTGPT